MLVGDVSGDPLYASEAAALEDRLVAIMLASKRHHDALGAPPADTNPEDHWDLAWYRAEARLNRLFRWLYARAERPLLAKFTARYLQLWGPRANMSYFFPRHTFASIWRRAHTRAMQ